MGRIVFQAWHLKTMITIGAGVLGLVLVVAGSLYYVNLQTVHQVGLKQVFNGAVAGRIVAVDPGHGGYDPGAKGAGGTLEKDLNLAIAFKLKETLEQAGAKVVLTRDRDVDLVTPGEGTKKFRDLSNRLKIVRESKADLLVSIHMNSSGSRWRGAQVFYHPQSEANRSLAVAIQEEIRSRLGNTSRQALSLTSAYLLQEASIPAVIVEAGFITNPAEEKLLNDPAYQQSLAQAIAAGIIRFLAEQQ